MILRCSRISAVAMVASVFAFTSAAPRTASANLLLYDGFATVTDGDSRTPYMSTSDTHKLQSDNAKGEAWTTGVSKNYPWSETSAVVFTFRNNGLSLPSAFADGTGDQFTARGGSVGWLNSSYSAQIRGKNRKITSAMPTSGTLYYRCLMKIEANAFSRMKEATDRYAAAGLTCRAAENKYDNGYTMAQIGFRVYFIGTGSTVALMFGVGKGDGNGTIDNTLVGSVTAGTTYLCIVGIDYGTGKACAYATPIADYTKTFSWTVDNVDASGITGSAVQTMFVDGIYQTNNGRVLVDEIAAGTGLGDVAVFTPSGAPALGDVSLSRTGAATYAVTAEEAENTADTMSWIADSGTAVTTHAFATAVATNTTASGTVSGLAADKTYQVSVLAENASGADEKVAGVFYAGELALGTVTDADEYNCVPGGVEVSRAVADPWPLTVNYTISGSDGMEGTTWVAPTAVTIAADAASAILPVVPLMDDGVTSNITITVTLAAGNYEIPVADSKTLTLANIAPPTGKKTWIAAENGNASNGDNWFPAGAPTASDHILFDGSFSTARCTWDAAATHAVASWEQTAAFTGTVELQTTYEDGNFPALSIANDFTVNGGIITQKKNEDVQTYRISVSVDGDFIVATGAKITATGKGYDTCHYPVGSACGVHAGSMNNLSQVYGNLKHPVDIGSAGSTSGFKGGGAIHLVVAGEATVNGTIEARASTGSVEKDTRYKGHGAGGSIYLEAATVTGTGSITVAGYEFASSWQRPGGAGGRIAVICTSAESMSFPSSKLNASGSISSYGNTSGAGTIFVKTSSQQNGTLIVDNALSGWNQYEGYWPTKRGVTPIPAGASWTLDEVKFRRFGVLCVPEGTSLSVPISGVSADSDQTAGILYEGGVLDFGPAPYTLARKWTFQADRPYTFNGDVTVTNGANIGGLRFSGNYTNDFAACDVVVNGNLTIASGGYASVQLAGPVGRDGTGTRPNHGGQCADVSGNKCYGSVFNPILPGHYSQNGNHGSSGPGGGVLRLTVTGNLAVEGKISADGICWEKTSAAAGSINIMAATISGSGSITARGYVGTPWGDPSYNGPGGRIAVRTTGEEIGTIGVWTKLEAMGCSTNQLSNNGKPYAGSNNQNTSAGTIYLQGASDGEKGGTIYVKNQASYDTSNVATWIPAATLGDAAEDFKKAKLIVADRGVVAIGADIRFASVSVAARSKLDLHGQKVKTQAAWLGGDKLAPGTYTAANAAISDFVADSAGGGELIVSGQGTIILLQ